MNNIEIEIKLYNYLFFILCENFFSFNYIYYIILYLQSFIFIFIFLFHLLLLNNLTEIHLSNKFFWSGNIFFTNKVC